MDYRSRPGEGPQLDMRPDGSFALPPGRGPARPPRGGMPRPGLPWPVRIGIVAGLVALVATGIAGAALALWFVLALIPVIAIAVLVAWAAFQIQIWRSRRSGRFRRDVFRP
jgi:hypothetical protein